MNTTTKINKPTLSEIKLTPRHKGRLVHVYNRFINREWVGYLDQWTDEFFDMKIGNAIHTFNRSSAHFIDDKQNKIAD